MAILIQCCRLKLVIVLPGAYTRFSLEEPVQNFAGFTLGAEEVQLAKLTKPDLFLPFGPIHWAEVKKQHRPIPQTVSAKNVTSLPQFKT